MDFPLSVSPNLPTKYSLLGVRLAKLARAPKHGQKYFEKVRQFDQTKKFRFRIQKRDPTIFNKTVLNCSPIHTGHTFIQKLS